MTEGSHDNSLNEIADRFARQVQGLSRQMDALLAALASADFDVPPREPFDATPNAFRRKDEWTRVLSPQEEIARSREMLREISGDFGAIRARLNQMLSARPAWRER